MKNQRNIKKKDFWGRILTITPQGRRLRVSNFAKGDKVIYNHHGHSFYDHVGVVINNGCSSLTVSFNIPDDFDSSDDINNPEILGVLCSGAYVIDQAEYFKLIRKNKHKLG